MTDVFRKIRCFGVKGVFRYLKRKIFERKVKAFVIRDAVRHPMVPRVGLTVVAEFGASNSLNKTMRDLVVMLKRANIPFQTLDVTRGLRRNRDVDDLLTPIDEFRSLAYNHVIGMVGVDYPDFHGIKQLRIAFWEFESGMTEAFPVLRNGCVAIGMSDFNVDTLRRELGAEKTRKLLYPFVFDKCPESGNEIRKKYRIPADAFVVFFNFDYTAFLRKNPIGAVRAFASAFAGDRRAVLVFKSVKGDVYGEFRNELLVAVRESGIERQFLEIDGYVPVEEVYGLTAMCDVYLSMHRGEGFGLGIAEAMSLGKCVVVTGFSAPMEYCTSENSVTIPYVKRAPDLNERHGIPYSWAVRSWADPDVCAAGAALKDLFTNHRKRSSLGFHAANDIARRFSVESFELSVRGLFGE